MLLHEYGYLRVGTAVPGVTIADPQRNLESILTLIKQADEQGIEVLVFPELAITGYTCAELFNQTLLLDASDQALLDLATQSRELAMLIVVGAPIRVNNRLFNCAVVIHRGQILAIIPKIHMPSYREFYETRWFSAADEVNEEFVDFHGFQVPISPNTLVIDEDSEAKIAIEICEDLWVPNAPSIRHAQRGANIILNLSASNETMDKRSTRRDLVLLRSNTQICGYVYASCGSDESTTDLVFSGHCMIAQDGDMLYENRFLEKGRLGFADIDYDKLQQERLRTNSFENVSLPYNLVSFRRAKRDLELTKSINKQPFLAPVDPEKDYQDVLLLQALGLKQRLKKTGIEYCHLGVSGGLDSTWALIVTMKALELQGLPLSHLKAISMPGFGTSEQTKDNIRKLIKSFAVDFREIDITKSVLRHFEDIGHDPKDTKVVYENAQARERTQILFDLANKEGGLVVGTGDLSEIALGWATYNGDHMSNYAVNASVPKTLIRALIAWYAEQSSEELREALLSVLGTPVSPELLPPGADGAIAQKTEDIIGDYDYNDFFLYQVVGFGYAPKKVVELTYLAFEKQKTRKEIALMLKNFYKRFITQQFKRNAAPDGPKVTRISLSSRGDFKLPSDASSSLWLRELEKYEETL